MLEKHTMSNVTHHLVGENKAAKWKKWKEEMIKQRKNFSFCSIKKNKEKTKQIYEHYNVAIPTPKF